LIALLATVVLAAGWMAFLRPAAVQTTTEEVTAPAKVATQARQAAAATEKANAATEAKADEVAGEPAAKAPTPAPAQKAKPAQAPAPAATAKPEAKAPAKKADRQAAVVKDLDAHKVVVLLFWDKAGADDRAAREAVEHLDRRGGKVAVHAIDVKDVGEYGSVTQGVSVAQSPTTIVVSPNAKARVVAGLTDPTEVDQLVRQALITSAKRP
jgi:hypothetical protein